MLQNSSGNEGNTLTSEYQGSKSSEPSEFCEDCTNPTASASEQPRTKKSVLPTWRMLPEKGWIEPLVAATREFRRQKTTHLTQNE